MAGETKIEKKGIKEPELPVLEIKVSDTVIGTCVGPGKQIKKPEEIIKNMKKLYVINNNTK